MTLPDERYRAVTKTQEFLLSLCDAKKTPRVPKEIRETARNLLRHYPSEYYMEIVSENIPYVFKKDKSTT